MNRNRRNKDRQRQLAKTVSNQFHLRNRVQEHATIAISLLRLFAYFLCLFATHSKRTCDTADEISAHNYPISVGATFVPRFVERYDRAAAGCRGVGGCSAGNWSPQG